MVEVCRNFNEIQHYVTLTGGNCSTVIYMLDFGYFSICKTPTNSGYFKTLLWQVMYNTLLHVHALDSDVPIVFSVSA